MERDNSLYYTFNEQKIKKDNIHLWNEIMQYTSLKIPFKQRFYMLENDLTELPQCVCGNLLKFISFGKGYRKYCSRHCMINDKDVKEKRKKTCIDRYGVDNPSKSPKVKEKVRQTNRELFGVDYPTQSEKIKEKMKEDWLELYGVDNPSKIPEIRDKAKNTMMERYGVEYAMHSEKIVNKMKEDWLELYGVDSPFKIDTVRDKIKTTMMERYGVEYALQNPDVMKKFKETNMERYGSTSYVTTDEYIKQMEKILFDKNSLKVNTDNYTLIKCSTEEFTIDCNVCSKQFKINKQLYRKRLLNKDTICLNCNKIDYNYSITEKEILKYIEENYDGEIISNYRLNNIEIDIYLPELKIGFEYNGLYWHSEFHKIKKYHQNKFNHYIENDIHVIQIWEDDYKFKKDIILSMINNKLNLSKRIYGRKTEIKLVNNKEVKLFLENNHIQGHVNSKVKIGLYFENRLVSLMTFGSKRISTGNSSEKGTWELLRFCNKIGVTVIGGASKLFKHFIKTYDYDEIMTYSKNDHSKGNLYLELGFEYNGDTVPNYYWCNNGIRYNRFNYRKDRLVSDGYDINKTEVEIMHDRKFFRVFDSGSKKWIFKRI